MKRWALALGLIAVLVAAQTAAADHDANDEPWRQPIIAACEPAWDPHDDRIRTWDGRTLHEESFAVRDLFYRTWGDADLDRGRHLRRWRWEYECTHPQPIVDSVQASLAPQPSSAGDEECTHWVLELGVAPGQPKIVRDAEGTIVEVRCWWSYPSEDDH
ncbi:MAG: hypothetical protein OXU21_01320 [Chloroflexota bacterium]|nr:hypothetical protein [Chloroflexota bacterium]